MLKFKNSKKQGDWGMGEAIAYFSRKGYTVCIPITDSQSYDLVVEQDSILKKVQVRTTLNKSKYGIYQVNLRTCGGKYGSTRKMFESGQFDLLFVTTGKGDSYLVPTNEIHCRSLLSLGKEMEKFLLP